MYRWRQDGFGTLATPPASVQTALQNASNQYGVPLPLLESVAQTESSYNPSAVSSAGAQGLMQIMPANDASFGVTNPFDAQQSANAGAAYLAQLYAQYGNWNTALIAYNQGPTALAQNGPYSSSQTYADVILANAGISTDLSAMGPPALDSSGNLVADTSGTGDSSLFDFSSLGLTDSSGNLSGVAWAGIAIAAAALVWAAA